MIEGKYFSPVLYNFVAERQLPWIKLERGKIVMIVDNHLLSTHRACNSAFFIQHVEGWKVKPGYGIPNERQWFLDFGIIFHKQMEYYYKHFRDTNFSVMDWATDNAFTHWMNMNIDMYSKHPEYHLIGGLKGFTGLLLQYAHRFSPDNEKLHILGTEIAFGKNREVCLYRDEYLEIYLAGRMDVIVDDGYFIMPMDHKTMKTFNKDPLELYNIDEGPTGYIYSLKALLPNYVPVDHILKRDCHRILINAISKTVPAKSPMDRFKRMCIWKTESQLSDYKERMIQTCFEILSDAVMYQSKHSVKRDTSHCTNWFHGRCPYYDIHTQSDKFGEQATLQNGFVKLPIWDTENISLNGA